MSNGPSPLSDYGEDQFIVMFGGLHIEMNSWKAFEEFLDESGWTTLLSKASVTSTSIADSFLKCSDVDRTRYEHLVTLLVLAILQEAWVAANFDDNNSEMTFELWKKNMVKCSPTFQYWGIVLDF